MRLPAFVILSAALALLSTGPSTAAWTFSASPDSIRAHMAYLASDELQGRDAGMPGFDRAASYVVNQFQEMGLKPGGGNGTFQQPVILIRHRAIERGAFKILGDRGGDINLAEGAEYRTSINAHGRDIHVTGQSVFVGYGVVAPGQDDYEGMNVRGKVVVALDGSPDSIAQADRQYVTSARAKAMMAERRGAIGLVLVSTTEPAAPPTRAGAAPGPRTSQFAWTWERPNGDAAYAGVPVLATLSPAGTARLFEGAATSYEAVRSAAAAKQPIPRFNLARRIDATAAGELGERRISSNVIAIIEGSDPRLKNQYIVMSGHLDHIGVLATTPADGDRINNGAFDNAGGIATLIEAARGFAEGPRPKRSVIFLAVTGEEKGLIGSDFFGNNPTVPKNQIIADVNLDMPVMTYDFLDVAAIGAEHSTIAEAVGRAAQRMNVALSPDPVPELGIFTRSDHYRFVEQGVPAVFLIGGFQNGGRDKFWDFYNNRYHKPGDDLSQAIDYQAGAKWARMNYEIAWELANQPERPVFNRNDLFGTRFASPAATAR